jgi:hypothetical protein
VRERERDKEMEVVELIDLLIADWFDAYCGDRVSEWGRNQQQRTYQRVEGMLKGR